MNNFNLSAVLSVIDVDIGHRDRFAQRRRHRPAGDVADDCPILANLVMLTGNAAVEQFQTDPDLRQTFS